LNRILFYSGIHFAVMETEAVQIDVEKQEQARKYASLQRRMMLVDLLLGACYLIAWLVLGWSAELKNALTDWTSNEWLLVAAYAIIFGGGYVLLTLPLSFYEGYILPNRFGLSNLTLRGWMLDQAKAGLLGGVLGLLVLEVIYAILRSFPGAWWLLAAGFLLIFNTLLANLAPVLIFPIFYKFTPLQAEHADLVARLMRLAKRARTQVRGVYVFDMSRRTKAANAALVGLGGTRRIILGDVLLNEFTPDEIETVIAHELGHHVHRDIPLGILFGTALTLVGLYLTSLGLLWGVSIFGFDGVADIAALPLLGIVFGLYGLVTLPLENAYSRWREVAADRYALQATGNGAAFASALKRLANLNLADADPDSWIELLLYSHPALSKRIAMADAYTPNP
jgi:STE24 endopeptidase